MKKRIFTIGIVVCMAIAATMFLTSCDMLDDSTAENNGSVKVVNNSTYKIGAVIYKASNDTIIKASPGYYSAGFDYTFTGLPTNTSIYVAAIDETIENALWESETFTLTSGQIKTITVGNSGWLTWSIRSGDIRQIVK